MLTAFTLLLATPEILADGTTSSSPLNLSEKPVTPLEERPSSYRIPPTGYVPPQATSLSKEGKALYDSMNCASCHSIGANGGTSGTPLDGIGGRRSEEYLMAHLTNPAEHAKRYPHLHPLPTMPHPHATSDEVRALVSYLITLPEPKAGFLIQAHPVAVPKEEATSPAITAMSTEEGRRLFLDHGCAGCHSIGGSGSSFGPKLDYAGRLGHAYIQSMITRRGKGASPMSWRNVSSEDASKIAEYLMTLPQR